MRKDRVAVVVGTKMDRTAVVEMVWKQRHRVYRKQMRRISRFYVHDPENLCMVGDTVSDLQMAKAAGATALAITGGAGSREELEEQADVVSDSLEEISVI